MSSNRSLIQFLVVAMTMSCSASTNEVEKAILSFPDIGAYEFTPKKAVRSANVFITMGKASACVALANAAPKKREWVRQVAVNEHHKDEWDPKQWLAEEEVNRKICHLCRLLFTPRTSV